MVKFVPLFFICFIGFVGLTFAAIIVLGLIPVFLPASDLSVSDTNKFSSDVYMIMHLAFLVFFLSRTFPFVYQFNVGSVTIARMADSSAVDATSFVPLQQLVSTNDEIDRGLFLAFFLLQIRSILDTKKIPRSVQVRVSRSYLFVFVALGRSVEHRHSCSFVSVTTLGKYYVLLEFISLISYVLEPVGIERSHQSPMVLYFPWEINWL